MKITLIFPPSLYQTKQTMPPLGIAWIAAVLRENGYKDIILIDSVINNYTNEDIINILKKDGLNIKLIIIGQKADETKKINRLIIKLNLSQNIKIFSIYIFY